MRAGAPCLSYRAQPCTHRAFLQSKSTPKGSLSLCSTQKSLPENTWLLIPILHALRQTAPKTAPSYVFSTLPQIYSFDVDGPASEFGLTEILWATPTSTSRNRTCSSTPPLNVPFYSGSKLLLQFLGCTWLSGTLHTCTFNAFKRSHLLQAAFCHYTGPDVWNRPQRQSCEEPSN